MTLLRHASPRSSRLWIYFLILLTFPIGDRSSRIVEGGRGYAPRGYAPRGYDTRSSRLRTLPPPPRRTCSLGVENPDTGLVMSDGVGDSSKWVASLSASNAVTCARHCCRHESCSLAWFISDQDIDYAEENENCFLVNCEDPHVCRLKRSDLRDSVTHVYRKRGTPGEEYPSTTRASTRKLKKLTKKPTTVSTTTTTTMAKKKKTTRSKIDPFMKAVENNNLEAHELKLLLDTLGTLSSEEQLKIDQLIDKVLDKYGTNATTAEATTTTPTTTTTTTPTTTTTTTTTPTTTTTTTKTAATTTTERSKSPTSSASTKTTATGKKTADSQTAEAELTKKKTKSPEETTVKKATTTTTAAATAKETTTKKSKRPDWMQPRDSAVVDAGTDASAGVVATVDVEVIQLKPPRVHMGLLTAACVIGVVATIVVVFSMQRRVLNAWRKKDYIDADYLINGMYQPNI